MKKKLILYPIIAIVALLILTTITFSLLTKEVVVDGNSMMPTIKNAEYGSTWTINKTKVKRFTIIVFRQDGQVLIKRIIGLPNEEIEYRDNQLYINKVLAEDKYQGEAKTIEDFHATLKANQYFVLGDNRANSYDSRHFGAINKQAIIGRGFIRLGHCKKIKNGKCDGLSYSFPQQIK